MILKFFKDTKKEILKISWVSKKEVLLSSAFIFMIIALFSVFFLISDLLISKIITYLLQLVG